MSVHDDIRQALSDAIYWQAGLAEAWQDGSPERQEALDQIKAYRKILKRRYGDRRTPDEVRLEGAELVDIMTLREQNFGNK